jgi:ribosomal protein S18 acetylase RimI-like enzyme
MAEGSELRIRAMTAADIDFAIERIREAGWASQSREVFAAFLDHDPRGCFVAGTGSERVGICVATRYRDNAFIGELVVRRDRRILGAGRLLLHRALSYLDGQGIRDTFLDGDLNAVPYYEAVGFKKIGRSLRFRGRIQGRAHPDVRPLRAADLDMVCARDLEFFGDDRSFFLRRFAGLFPELGFVRENDDGICGYIMAKPGQELLAVGPWADWRPGKNSPHLLEHLAAASGAEVFRIGVMESNEKAAALLRSFPGLAETPYCWFMGRGDSRRLGNHPALYAIGSGAKG